ncbi:hypothetical protein Gohar_018806 [Gossypium harknessii]|uniref:Uncharacterized protein n=1 Tax=Gossypium harknessii TaxID=34285 RepID=A0A7J9GAH4_9ROSI|nr:hypothetical protein [Gossypium harknessii]
MMAILVQTGLKKGRYRGKA